MTKSERFERYNESVYDKFNDNFDSEFEKRITALLNHPKIDKFCMVDAYYYDFSVIPHEVQERLNLWRDAYLIFGITTEGEIVSKWVDRWDLDSTDEIIDGKVIQSEPKPMKIPEIKQQFSPDLLSTPAPEFMMKMFRSKKEI